MKLKLFIPLLLSIFIFYGIGNAQTENNTSTNRQSTFDRISSTNKSAEIIYLNDTTIEIEKPIQVDSTNRENPRTGRPFSLSIYGGSPTIIASLALDYFIRPDISIEAGGGLFGFYAGGRYHFRGKKIDKKWTTYTGLMCAIYTEQIGTDMMLMAPVGEQFIGKKGFNFAVELMYLFAENGPAVYPVWFGLKFGYRFKFNRSSM